MKLDQHTPRSLSMSVSVFLDGIKVEDCVEAYVGNGKDETEGLGYIIGPVTDSVNAHGVASVSVNQTKARDGFDYDGLWCTMRMGYVKIDIDEDLRKRLEYMDAPKIICLCGSTKFVDTWINEYQRLSDQGYIVLTVARMPPRPNLHQENPELKIRLDKLHKQKIDLCDEIFVLNVGGYIGESTRSEIRYAQMLGKKIVYMEPNREQDIRI